MGNFWACRHKVFLILLELQVDQEEFIFDIYYYVINSPKLSSF